MSEQTIPDGTLMTLILKAGGERYHVNLGPKVTATPVPVEIPEPAEDRSIVRVGDVLAISWDKVSPRIWLGPVVIRQVGGCISYQIVSRMNGGFFVERPLESVVVDSLGEYGRDWKHLDEAHLITEGEWLRLRYQQFGASLGGPAQVGEKWDGHQKALFAFEGAKDFAGARAYVEAIP